MQRCWLCHSLTLHLQAGALEVLGMLLTSLPFQQTDALLSSSICDDDCEDENESTIIQEVWLAAVGVLSQVVVHNPKGSKQILQVQYCIHSTLCFLYVPSVSNLENPHVRLSLCVG